MTKRKPSKKSEAATAERMAPVLAKVRAKIAEGQAAICRAKAAPPAAVTTEKKQSAAPSDASASRGITLPGTPWDKAPLTDAEKGAGSEGRVQVHGGKGETLAEFKARVGSHPAVINSNVTRAFNSPAFGNLDMNAAIVNMVDRMNALAKGDTSLIEQHLIAQAAACESIFCEMARRAALNMGTYIEPTEIYLRLAFKAQAQSRATLETLAEIKNPRPIYLNPKQVNNVTGNQQNNSAEGPQQVNNGSAPEPVRAEENKKPENKLLETS